jgi:glycosyltransferase involved in cell wall biosynthesis
VKILHVMNSTNPSHGGPSQVISQTEAFLNRLGHFSEIVCVDPLDSPWLKDATMTTHALGPAWTRYRFTTRLVPWLRAHARDYDCAVVHGLWRYNSFAAWRALRTTGTPYFLYVHGMLDPVFRRFFPGKHLQKWLHWVLFEHYVARDARALIFCCQEEARKAAIAFRPYQVTTAIVPCCVPAPPSENCGARNAFYECWPEVRGKRMLLFLGRLHRKKGCDLLIEAFGRVATRDSNLQLVMAGYTDELDWIAQLKRRTQALGIASQVTWTGSLPVDMKWSAFRTADAFVLPSFQENFGIAVVEALACGTPVLISRGVDIWSEILAEEAGLVGEVGIAGTVDLVERWSLLSADDRNTLRSNAANCYTRRFRPEAATSRLVDVLRGQAGNGPTNVTVG